MAQLKIPNNILLDAVYVIRRRVSGPVKNQYDLGRTLEINVYNDVPKITVEWLSDGTTSELTYYYGLCRFVSDEWLDERILECRAEREKLEQRIAFLEGLKAGEAN